MILVIDIAAMLTALAAAWLWWQASRSTLRRVDKTEQFDYHDFNPLIVACGYRRLRPLRRAPLCCRFRRVLSGHTPRPIA